MRRRGLDGAAISVQFFSFLFFTVACVSTHICFFYRLADAGHECGERAPSLSIRGEGVCPHKATTLQVCARDHVLGCRM